eukprot:scaffold62996_cov23-Tisochrysis_lutea.AAC.1
MAHMLSRKSRTLGHAHGGFVSECSRCQKEAAALVLGLSKLCIPGIPWEGPKKGSTGGETFLNNPPCA